MVLFSFVLYVTLCVSFLKSVEAISVTVTGSTLTSISAHVNMLAVGDPTKATTAQSTGHVGVTYYDYRTSDWTDREAVLLNPFVYNTGTSKVIYGDANTNINANNGFGYDVSCANEETLFISACNKDYNSGRVYMYKGRHAHWTAQQILNSYRTGPSETYMSSSDTFFGEALASSESILAVGCRNCNSSIGGYAQSGEIYVFRPDNQKKSVLWTNTQILTGKDIYFLGGRVAMHENVIVASGNSKEPFTLNTIQTTPILASIFLAEDYLESRGPKSEFKYQHNIVTRDPIYQRVADVAVYDMTIAMSTYDVVHDFNNVYVFYPNTKKYRLESKDAKGKPRPLSWSLVQVLSLPAASYNYKTLTYLSLWDNRLFMRAIDAGGTDVTLDTNRTSRDGTYFPFYLKEFVPTNPNTNHMMVATDFKLFEDGNTGTATRTAAAVKDLASPAMNCLRIWVEDEFDDGWDVAELIVESPNGIKRSYKTECDSVNPLVHRYCPVFHDEPSSKGIHKMYVINGKEAKFNWEILWRVYDEATAKWYLGDVNTEMDFEWQYRDHEFLNTRMHNMRHNLTCTVCPQDETEWYEYQKKLNPEKPKPKAQALQNLRSRALHSRTETSAPSISPAPTIAVDFNKDWNSIEMINDAGGGVTDSWFQGEGWGTFFYISDTKGKKMVYGGSACTAGNVAVSCYVKLDDGDYVLRVTGANDPATLQRRWKFCQGLNYQASQTELYFSVVDGVCFPVMTRHQTLVCDNILKITNLMVEVALSGDYSDLIKFSDRVHHNVNVQQLQPIAAGVSTGLQQIFGFEEHSSSIVRIISSTAAGIIVLVDVGVKGFDESMYDILKTIELGGGQSYRTVVASHVLSSPVSLDQDASVVSATTHVAITSIKIGSETVDHAAEDESAFHEITEFIPQTSTVRSPNELLVKSEYFVALAGYALTLATVIMAIGFLYAKVKQRLNPCDPLVEAAPIKPSVARANLSTLHLVESSSDDESDDGDAKSSSHADGQDEENRRNSTRRKDLSLNGIRNDAPTARRSKSNSRDKLKKLLEDEDAVYRQGSGRR